MKTVLITILTVSILGIIAYLVYKKTQKPKERPKPNASWTKQDWLNNGYTEEEFNKAKQVNMALLSQVMTF